jgi:hypothetical protein
MREPITLRGEIVWPSASSCLRSLAAEEFEGCAVAPAAAEAPPAVGAVVAVANPSAKLAPGGVLGMASLVGALGIVLEAAPRMRSHMSVSGS